MSDRRFTKSDYVSFMTWAHMDEPNADGIPLYLDSETNGLYMWRSDENPPATLREVPEIGTIVSVRTPIEYEGEVKEYFFAYGWVGLKINPFEKYRKALAKTNYGRLASLGKDGVDQDFPLVWNYGIDLLGVVRNHEEIAS